MLQFGGHHLAINLTLAGSQASMTPSLPAAQPANYTFEGREIRPLGKENDKAFALINALDATQRSQAILTYRVSPTSCSDPGQDGRTIQPEGIRASALSPAQQTMLLDIVREWAGIMNDAFAEPRMAEIRANLPQTYFAWSGPTTNGSAAYFRIQGPTLVIEYAPQRQRRPHPHHLPRSDQRLRCEVRGEVDASRPRSRCGADRCRECAAVRAPARRVPAGGAHRDRSGPRADRAGSDARHRRRRRRHRRHRSRPDRRPSPPTRTQAYAAACATTRSGSRSTAPRFTSN